MKYSEICHQYMVIYKLLLPLTLLKENKKHRLPKMNLRMQMPLLV